MKSSASLVIAILIALVISSQPVFAYLDPGSGSMFLQLLLGGVAGLAVIGKLYWRKLWRMFGKKTDDDEKSAELEKEKSA